MKNLWNSKTAADLKPLELRAYSSRLLGQNEDLVLFGGGNTSLKQWELDFWGEKEQILYVKSSGQNLATIQPSGFTPLQRASLLKLLNLSELTDDKLLLAQQKALTSLSTAAASIESLIHAYIPFPWVDHTHADPVVVLSHLLNLEELSQVFGPKTLIIPYQMPGFGLAKAIWNQTKNCDWANIEALILEHHGIFTFAETAEKSYSLMIEYASRAEEQLARLMQKSPASPKSVLAGIGISEPSAAKVAMLRREISQIRRKPILARYLPPLEENGFSYSPQKVLALAGSGILTPDHVVHSKPFPLCWETSPEENLKKYSETYKTYFAENASETLKRPLPLSDGPESWPRWAVGPNLERINFAETPRQLKVVEKVTEHTLRSWVNASLTAERWRAIPESEIFKVEFWDREVAKTQILRSSAEFSGQVVVITGAASGIGKACVDLFAQKGAAVAALDLAPAITDQYAGSDSILGIICDITDSQAIKRALSQIVKYFGGVDILVSNAGMFPKSMTIEQMEESVWDKALQVNLTGHQKFLTHSVEYLKLGINPSVVIVGSKNVPAPGPGASAYSVAKAGLTQLARVAAMELGPLGIPVNIIHPNAVFDTAIWTPAVLESRAKSYGLSVEEYKRNNILKTEISSQDVAQMIAVMAGPIFHKTTAAQIPIDGGNERVL